MGSKYLSKKAFILGLGLQFILNIPLIADISKRSAYSNREENFAQFYTESVLPLFEKSISGAFHGVKEDEQPVELKYRILHAPNAKAGVLIVHGFGERMEKYAELAYDFYQQGYNVYLYDQRGHGASSRLQKGSQAVHVTNFGDYVEDLKLFLEEVVLEEQSNKDLFIFAHSMGAAAVSQFLMTYPGFIKAAVLSTPMHQINLQGYPRKLAQAIASAVNFFGYGGAYALGQSSPKPWPFRFAATSSRARWEFYNDVIIAQLPAQELSGGASYRWLKESLEATHALLHADELEEIDTPILLFQAGRDNRVEAEGQNIFCEKIKSCRLIRYDEAKHEIYREKDAIRQTYLNEIFDFFRSHSQSDQATKVGLE